MLFRKIKALVGSRQEKNTMEFSVTNFDSVAREVFAPIYPVIAEEIKNQTKILAGSCIDLGCGGGYLGLSLAQITNLKMYLFDILPGMQTIADKNIKEYLLEDKVTTVLGDVHEMPFKDNSINLIISRGSIFFWEDQAKAIREIYRVLAPGGKTFIGGGFGSLELKTNIIKKMRQRDPSWNREMKERIDNGSEKHFCSVLEKAGVTEFKIKNGDSGIWIMIEKLQQFNVIEH